MAPDFFARAKKGRMKGQYKIVSEIMLFAAGVAIASFVIISFSGVKDVITRNAMNDQLASVSDLIATAIIKASQSNSVVRIEVPATISGEAYRISVIDKNRNTGVCTKGNDCFLNLSLGSGSEAKQVFNISQNYNIKGDVASTAAFIEIISMKGGAGGDVIVIERGVQ